MIGKRLTLVLMSAFFLLAVGCARTPAPRQTVQTPEYPEDRYLVATGYGDSPAEAARDARGAMAAIFSSTVYAETMAQATSAFDLDGKEQFEKQVASTVQVISTVALQGVQVVDQGKDAKTGAYAALAVLDRRQAAARWQRDLEAAGERLDAEMAALPAVTGALSRLAALNRITGLDLEQTALASRLRVVRGSAAALAADPADMKAVVVELTALRQKISFLIMLEGDQADAAIPVIRAGLSREGLRITDDAATAAGRISGTIALQPLSIDNPKARFVRALITADLVDAGTGAVLMTVTARVRKAHADETEAARMAVRAAAEQVVSEIAAALGQLTRTGQ
ncbi:MAG: LPP20 family lipoprotein [Pseudomonadota bacterium]